VIGDPVNEAARLTELAKSVSGRVLANATLLDAADGESPHWTRQDPVTVRGRSAPTPVATPV
jgi:adenylate cyclase